MSALLQALFGASTDAKSRNVIFVMTDGLRWQEVFRGADAALINKEHGNVSDPEELKKALALVGYKAREISAQLNRPPRTVYRVLERVKKRLQRLRDGAEH